MVDNSPERSRRTRVSVARLTLVFTLLARSACKSGIMVGEREGELGVDFTSSLPPRVRIAVRVIITHYANLATRNMD